MAAEPDMAMEPDITIHDDVEEEGGGTRFSANSVQKIKILEYYHNHLEALTAELTQTNQRVDQRRSWLHFIDYVKRFVTL